ncbi:pilus assembly protein PilM, partial [Escherichia coli]|nr:pilus assembly protein PilM [Escherichia coli]
MKKELPFGAKRVAISVPDNSVISKKLQIEQSLDESEIEFAVVQAFSHQSPFPVEELSLDFVRLRAEEGMR